MLNSIIFVKTIKKSENIFYCTPKPPKSVTRSPGGLTSYSCENRRHSCALSLSTWSARSQTATGGRSFIPADRHQSADQLARMWIPVTTATMKHLHYMCEGPSKEEGMLKQIWTDSQLQLPGQVDLLTLSLTGQPLHLHRIHHMSREGLLHPQNVLILRWTGSFPEVEEDRKKK